MFAVFIRKICEVCAVYCYYTILKVYFSVLFIGSSWCLWNNGEKEILWSNYGRWMFFSDIENNWWNGCFHPERLQTSKKFRFCFENKQQQKKHPDLSSKNYTFCIVVKYTQYVIYYFKVYNSMALCTFTVLCKHHHHLVSEHFCHLRKEHHIR